MTNSEKLEQAISLIQHAIKLVDEVKTDIDGQASGPVKADDAGGSNPPGNGQPGKP